MAILGDGVALAIAGRVAGVSPVGGLARALRDMEVLAEEDPICFAHPIVQLALRSDPDGDADDRLVRRAIDVLDDTHAPPEQIARLHLLLRPGSGRPVEALRRAAAIACARGAPDVGVAFLRRANIEPPPASQRLSVLRELGLAEDLVGSASCVDHFAAALELTADSVERAAITLDLANSHMMLGEVSSAVAAIETQLDWGMQHGAAGTELLEATLCALAFWRSGPSPRAVELLRRFEHAPPVGDVSVRLVRAARAIRMERTADDSVALARAVLADDGLLRGPPLAWILAVATLISCDELNEAETVYAQAESLARLSGSSRALGMLMSLGATLSYAQGDLATCESRARTQLGPLRLDVTWSVIAYATSVLLRSLVRRGDFLAAEVLLAEADPEPWPESTNIHYFFRSARGELRFAQGRHEDAVADLAASRQCLDAFSGFAGARFAVCGENEPLALDRVGRAEEARVMVKAGLADARRYGTPRNLAAVLRVGGLLQNGDRGIATLREAVGLLEGSRARLELSQCSIDLGMLRRHAGDRVAARADLTRGLDLASECGATALVQRARAELAATGARPRRDRIYGREALTPTERRLAELAAAGRSNREIAQELFVSEKTVEMHLGRAYRKLAIAGRNELRAALNAAQSSAEPS